MADPLLVGVDGGGTHCRVRIRRLDGSLLGQAEGGTANVFAGVEPALRTIVETVRAALVSGGEAGDALPRCVVGLGLAGANVPSVAAEVRATPLPFAASALESDAFAACRGAFAGADGAIAILGTGSAYALRVKGERRILGGYGMIVSDHASGADLGRRALAAALLAHDGFGPVSDLTFALMARFDGSPYAITEFARDAKPRDFGGLAPLVWDHADMGDAVALRLVEEGLSILEASARRCLDLGAPAIALLGGQAARYRPRLSSDLAARTVEPAGDALEGALDLAREALAARARP